MDHMFSKWNLSLEYSDSDWSRCFYLIILPQYLILLILSHPTALLSNYALFAHQWSFCHVCPLHFLIQKYLVILIFFDPENLLNLHRPPFLNHLIHK